TNGAVEGANKILINALRRDLTNDAGAEGDTDKWPLVLPDIVQRLNNRIVGTTGCRPSDLLLGYERRDFDPRHRPLSTEDVAEVLGEALDAVLDRRLAASAHRAFTQATHELAFETMYERQAKRKAQRDAQQAKVMRHKPPDERSGRFSRGDLVLGHASWYDVEAGGKLAQQWHGPYTVVARGSDERADALDTRHESNVTYWLFDQRDGMPIRGRIHANRLKPYRGDPPSNLTHALPSLSEFMRIARTARDDEVADPVDHAGTAEEPTGSRTDEKDDNSEDGSDDEDYAEDQEDYVVLAGETLQINKHTRKPIAPQTGFDDEVDTDRALHQLTEDVASAATDLAAPRPNLPDPADILPGTRGTLRLPHPIANERPQVSTADHKAPDESDEYVPPPFKRPPDWCFGIGGLMALLPENLDMDKLYDAVAFWLCCPKPTETEWPTAEREDHYRMALADLCVPLDGTAPSPDKERVLEILADLCEYTGKNGP
ncbi:hypothetical protein OIV83_006536, partial [Microbotryomycetes sp. JL201]